MAHTGYIVLTYKFSRVDRRWTAYCEELGTATFGRSLPEAEKKLAEAVKLHLDTLKSVGERERFFKEQNIQVHEVKPKKEITIRLTPRQDVFIHPHVQEVPTFALA